MGGRQGRLQRRWYTRCMLPFFGAHFPGSSCVSPQVLIIDEISMIDGQLFDKLEFIVRSLRKSSEPFGGIQVVGFEASLAGIACGASN